MANRLAQETSPYLLQHKANPVDWYPWGEEAIERSRQEDKAIFLSIGYSACHWCHVMEHESFESEAIAKLLNEKFVCIKVDREERPDLDQLYMNAVQMMTGRGGWPMSVFLTPDLKPFYCGTYWPPTARQGMPGFDQVVNAVAHAWETNREAVLETSEKLTQELERVGRQSSAGGKLSVDLVGRAVAQLRQTFDSNHGGFGGAPKFPAPMSLRLLLRYWRRQQDESSLEMVRVSLDRMAAGGIYDHLGGGFARYSVDARWLVPHFEKMLYDNALLASTYVEAFQVTGDENYARVVRETIDYVLRDMTDAEGGFYSTEDADSEGVEGKFYTWTLDELREVLDDDAATTFARVYDVTDGGNFEGVNILNLPKTLQQQASILGRGLDDLKAELAVSRQKLFAVREKRVHPHKDDKVIVAWNGLMIEALAAAGAVLGEERYLDAARRAADFLLGTLRHSDGKLLHTWRKGQAKFDGYLDDYTYLANGLIRLYESTRESRFLEATGALLDVVLEKFSDTEGGFFYTAIDQEALLVRSKDFADSAVPSSNAMAALSFTRLGKLTGKQQYLGAAEATMSASSELMQRFPTGTTQMLIAVDLWLGPTYELVLAGDAESPDYQQSLRELQRRFLPHKVLSAVEPSGDWEPPAILAELWQGKIADGSEPTLYVCEGFKCSEPVVGEQAISQALGRLIGSE